MVEQLDRLIEISRQDNIRLGVVGWVTPVTVPLLHAFTLYDSRAVLFATQTATALITEPRQVADYESHWSELMPFVSHGDEAREVLQRIAADYRNIV